MDQPDRINFRYVKDDGYRIVPASGAHGGITPDRQVIAHLFVELSALPETVTQEATSDGKLAQPKAPTPGDEGARWFERRLTVGILMAPDKARSIGQWLIAQAARVEQAKQADEGHE